MKIKVYKQKAEWAKSPIRDKELCFVEFPNCVSSTTGRSFKWLPTYKQIEEIRTLLDEVETQWAQR